MMHPIRHCIAALMLVLATAAGAAIEELEFTSEEQQARYENLIYELRCPKCLSGNLADSDAPIAADLRAEIYDQLQEGRSDEEIKEFMTVRYGDFILYRPRLNTGTALLWFGPLALLLAGFFIVRRMLAASRGSVDVALSPDEERQLHTLLKDGKES
jgi:cytochrome c-type biogenesis protein CcmH